MLSLDFATDTVGIWRGELRQRLQATSAGTVHAILASWEVYDGKQVPVGLVPAASTEAAAAAANKAASELVMSTHPDDTLHNFPRDMQWGQGLQLIEDLAAATDGAAPVPFVVSAGEWLVLVTRYSSDGVTLQFQLERDVEGQMAAAMEAAPAAPTLIN